MSELKKGSKKLLNAWAFYDWANSVYTLTISSAIFPIYYSTLFLSDYQTIKVFCVEFDNTALIFYLTAFTFLIVAFTSPILSGIADYVGNKKSFMKFFCYMGSIGCIGLYWFSLERIYLSLMFYFMGLMGFWGSLVFYNSYLPDLAFPEQQDRISAKGFSMGYLGSVILLVINLAMLMKPNWFGFDTSISKTITETGTESQIAEAIQKAKDSASINAMKISFITVGLWWTLFSQYTFYVLPKGVSKGGKITKDIIFNGLNELKVVWNQLKQNLRIKRYLYAFFVYSMAVQTIMLVATYFGEKEIAWIDNSQKTFGLIISVLVIQIVAIFGAVLTSLASAKYGNIRTLIVINFIWMGLCVIAYFITQPIQFYITASLVGLVMGGIQSLSRSTYSKLLPETKDTTSYFSFFDVAEKIGIVIGMVIYATMVQISTMRNATLFMFLFFFAGILLLLKVPAINSDTYEKK